MTGAAIAGIGATEFSKDSGRSELRLAVEAITAALADAGLAAADVDGLVTFTMDGNAEIAVAREPKDKEKESLEKFLATQRDYYREHADDAGKLLEIGYAAPTQGDPAELAAWTNLCRVILNSQEAITRY